MIKNRFKQFYLNIAKETAQLSRAERLKVGAIVVKNGNVIAFGFNGTPTGWDNKCERVKFSNNGFVHGTYGGSHTVELRTDKELVTVPEIIHAEMNSIYKLAKGNESGEGAAIFITHSPCLECSKGIFMSGIKEIYYGEEYRSKDGLDFLKKCGLVVEKL